MYDSFPSFKVKLFNGLELTGGGKTLTVETLHSAKLVKLLSYVLYNSGRFVSSAELSEMLWGSSEMSSPSGALKNLMYRLRGELSNVWPDFGADLIITSRRGYEWNPEVYLEKDTDEFISFTEAVSAKNFAPLERLPEVYSGHFVAGIEDNEWISSTRARFGSQWLFGVKTWCGILEDAGNYKKLEEISSYAIKLEPLDEELHCRYIMALAEQGRVDAAMEHYKAASETLMSALGVTTNMLKDIYVLLLRENHSGPASLATIAADLNASREKTGGAFFCEFGVFRQMYLFEDRQAARMGSPLFLGLFTVVISSNSSPESTRGMTLLSKSMKALDETLKTCLRNSDIVSKYSSTQYVVMLSACQDESTDFVINRITRRFNEEIKNPKVKLECSFKEVEEL